MSNSYVRFWGVRGSIPAPLTSVDVEAKIRQQLQNFVQSGSDDIDEFLRLQSLAQPFTYGGNTSCVEVRYGDTIIVLDMGTGLRDLGNALFPEMFEQKGLEIYFDISHIHWDHIQGLPFFGPLYVNKGLGIKNHWHFYGGTTWQETAEVCLKGQMDPPTFPVSWDEIEAITENITHHSMHDMMSVTLNGGTRLSVRKLHHPQETYGSRLEFPDGTVIAYTTDNEPFDPRYPDEPLVSLAKGADIWITDCQYTMHQYNGLEGGLPRRKWGHSYPEAVVATAVTAGVKKVILFHHDPASSDDRIADIQAQTHNLLIAATPSGFVPAVMAAYEGLTIKF